MKCTWYEEQLAIDSVELWPNNRPSRELLAHAEECRSCGARVDRELQLRGLFIELADESRKAEPSELVKRSLHAELALIRSTQAQARPRLGWRLALAAAALVCLTVGVILWRGMRPQSAPVRAIVNPASQPAPAISPAVTEPVEAVATKSAGTQSAKKNVQRLVGPREPERPAHSPSQDVVAADTFYPLVMCDSLTCPGAPVAVRVELPASPLAGHGSTNRTITADLLVGEDGLVRGVRVLQ